MHLIFPGMLFWELIFYLKINHLTYLFSENLMILAFVLLLKVQLNILDFFLRIIVFFLPISRFLSFVNLLKAIGISSSSTILFSAILLKIIVMPKFRSVKNFFPSNALSITIAPFTSRPLQPINLIKKYYRYLLNLLNLAFLLILQSLLLPYI